VLTHTHTRTPSPPTLKIKRHFSHLVVSINARPPSAASHLQPTQASSKQVSLQGLHGDLAASKVHRAQHLSMHVSALTRQPPAAGPTHQPAITQPVIFDIQLVLQCFQLRQARIQLQQGKVSVLVSDA
jgi:hypothetical protein